MSRFIISAAIRIINDFIRKLMSIGLLRKIFFNVNTKRYPMIRLKGNTSKALVNKVRARSGTRVLLNTVTSKSIAVQNIAI
jgi:hypothetical protein